MQIPHLVELGINAVELLPVFEYDELEFQRIPNPRDHMVNIWGYSHINFFAPMSRYAADGAGPVAAAKEFKQKVCLCGHLCLNTSEWAGPGILILPGPSYFEVCSPNKVCMLNLRL